MGIHAFLARHPQKFISPLPTSCLEAGSRRFPGVRGQLCGRAGHHLHARAEGSSPARRFHRHTLLQPNPISTKHSRLDAQGIYLSTPKPQKGKEVFSFFPVTVSWD